MKYAVALVIDASTEEQAFEGIADVLAKPHPWEGPVSAAFIGEPVEIADEEEYDSKGVASHIALSPEGRRVIGQLIAEGADADEAEAEAEIWEEIWATFPNREAI